MQLRQMDRVGLGGNISLVNQSVSLAFMVLVQVTFFISTIIITISIILSSKVVIIAEWFLIHRPITAVMVSGQLQCDVSRDTFLLLHVYIYVLLLINVFCSVSVYNIQKNFNDQSGLPLPHPHLLLVAGDALLHPLVLPRPHHGRHHHLLRRHHLLP